MTKKPDGGAAFPGVPIPTYENAISISTQSGMSLRDWFAGMALQGLCANSDFQTGAQTIAEKDGTKARLIIAQSALELADSMLEARDDS